MKKPFLNEAQQAAFDKLAAALTIEEQRMIPQAFEVWMEEHTYELNTYYEVTEVYNMGIDWPSFLVYNFFMALHYTDEKLQKLNEARAEEVSKLDSDQHFDPFEGTHPTDPELPKKEDEDKKDDDDEATSDLPY
jgi:hypothetical protein